MISPAPYPLVVLARLSKTFGPTTVLDGVDLTLHAGEVHGLLGENGSGKSTLIKVLAGFHAPDPGASLQVRGKDVPLPVPPGAFRELGISFVHQDLALVPELSVVENLRVGPVVAGRRPWISWRAERRSARALFERYGLDIDPAAPVSSLDETSRALVAILRAVEDLGEQRTLLVLDEPTVFLPRAGTDLLFSVVREIVADGRASVLLVSHDLEEVREHTDRVTVLRDGVSQGTRSTAELAVTDLVELIVGRPLVRPAAAGGGRPGAPLLDLTASDGPDGPNGAGAPAAEPVARVRGLVAGRAAGVDLDVAPGEVVGLTGIAGSGYDDVLPALYGARRARGGTLAVGGAEGALTAASPRGSLARGVVYVPPDRKTAGSAPELTVEDNATLPVLTSVGCAGGRRPLSRARLTARAQQLVEDYDVRPRRPRAAYAALSGGNQQKVLLAKWLQTDPRLVLLAEPTQGVDVGAREHIFTLLRGAAAGGAGVVVASSDHDQLAALCDRVLVLSRGTVTAVLGGRDGPALSKEAISDSVLGLTRQGASAG